MCLVMDFLVYLIWNVLIFLILKVYLFYPTEEIFNHYFSIFFQHRTLSSLILTL